MGASMTYNQACAQAQQRSLTYGVQFVTKIAGITNPAKAYRAVSEDRYNEAGLDDPVVSIYVDGQLQA
jgi:hypothetical protein